MVTYHVGLVIAHGKWGLAVVGSCFHLHVVRWRLRQPYRRLLMPVLLEEGCQVAFHIVEHEVRFLRRIESLEFLIIYMTLCVRLEIACPISLVEARHGILEVFESLL